MPHKDKKNAPTPTPMKRGGGGGRHKTRSKPQPLPEFQPTQEFSSPDDSATLMDVKKTLGMLTTALEANTTEVDRPSLPRQGLAGGYPTAASSASIDLNTKEQVQMWVEHRARTSHPPALAITDDEMDGGRRKGCQHPGKAQPPQVS